MKLLREFYANGNGAVFLVTDNHKKMVANLVIQTGLVTVELQETFEKGSLYYDIVRDFVYDTVYELEKTQQIVHELEKTRKID